MDSKSSSSTASAGKAGGHVHGDTLLAVAEGNADAQPDESTLAHIFSCDQCSQNVRDIRSGLAAMGVKPGAPRKPAPAAAAAAMPVLPFAPGEAPLPMPQPSDSPADRSRGLIWKVLLVGAVLGGALFYLRTFASSLH